VCWQKQSHVPRFSIVDENNVLAFIRVAVTFICVCGMSRCVACAGRSSGARSVHSHQEYVSLLSFIWHVTLCGVYRQKQHPYFHVCRQKLCPYFHLCVACHVVWRVQAEAISILSCVEAESTSVLSFVCGMSRCVACAGRSSEARSVHSHQEHVSLLSFIWHDTLSGVYRQKQHPYFHVCRQKLCPYFHLCVACHVVWRVQAEAVKRARSTVNKNIYCYFHPCGMSRCVACTGRRSIRTFMCAGRSYVRTFICVWHVTLYGMRRQKQ